MLNQITTFIKQYENKNDDTELDISPFVQDDVQHDIGEYGFGLFLPLIKTATIQFRTQGRCDDVSDKWYDMNTTTENILHYHLPISTKGTEIYTHSLLASYQTESKGDHRLERCDALSGNPFSPYTTQTVVVPQANNAFIVYFNRNTVRAKKSRTCVNVYTENGEELSTVGGKSLRSAIVHTGSDNDGHFIAYVRSGENRWYKCNDETITEQKTKFWKTKTFRTSVVMLVYDTGPFVHIKPKGILNDLNSCYVASALQCLVFSPSLRHGIDDAVTTRRKMFRIVGHTPDMVHVWVQYDVSDELVSIPMCTILANPEGHTMLQSYFSSGKDKIILIH